MIIGFASSATSDLKRRIAVLFAESLRRPVRYLDCDVSHALPSPPSKICLEQRETVAMQLPIADGYACMSCGECAAVCEKEAIALFAGMPLAFTELCDSCGDCITACIPSALSFEPRAVGEIRIGVRGAIQHVDARLIAGENAPIPVIKAAMRYLEKVSIGVVNCPMGYSNDTLATLKQCDYGIFLIDPSEENSSVIISDIAVIARQANVRAKIILVKPMDEQSDLRERFSKAGLSVLMEITEKSVGKEDDLETELWGAFDKIANECSSDYSV